LEKIMIEQLRKTAGQWALALGLIFVAALCGCQTGGTNYTEVPAEAGNTFHIGEVVTVKCVPLSGDTIPDHTERIGEDGNISLLYIGQVKAVDKTAAQLQKEIHDLYVPRYYNGLVVTVSGDAKYFYLDGEVRAPNKYEYTGQMSVVKAISVAGGFTDFARESKVQLTHNGHKQTVNVPKAIENPSLDVAVYPGDTIHVPRRWW
jgi:protein involved in polysaccharide export with SLBB domain